MVWRPAMRDDTCLCFCTLRAAASAGNHFRRGAVQYALPLDIVSWLVTADSDEGTAIETMSADSWHMLWSFAREWHANVEVFWVCTNVFVVSIEARVCKTNKILGDTQIRLAHCGLSDASIFSSQHLWALISIFDWNRFPTAGLERHHLQNGRDNRNADCKCTDLMHAANYVYKCLIKWPVQTIVAPPRWSVYVVNVSENHKANEIQTEYIKRREERASERERLRNEREQTERELAALKLGSNIQKYQYRGSSSPQPPVSVPEVKKPEVYGELVNKFKKPNSYTPNTYRMVLQKFHENGRNG